MRTDKLKKYLLPNFPYLFIVWACLKVGTSYRLAAGADLAHKLVGMAAAPGPAFADFAPGLTTKDRIVIVDPMGEYSPLVRRLGGQVIEIAPDSPLSMEADFFLSLCELVVDGKDGLSQT